MVESTNAAPLISVVVPVYNEEQGLPELRRRLTSSLADLEGGYELVLVDDGSNDGSADAIVAWTEDDPHVVFVELSRNFGMEIAMTAGLDHASGAFVAIVHADLQDPPELIPEMVALARSEEADVVYARRIGHEESRLKHTLAGLFYALMGRIARVPYQGQAGDFRVMSRRVVDTVRGMHERRRFLRGMVAWVGFKQIPIDYSRAGRTSGRGASYPALFRLAFEAIASFSDVPLKLATYAGTLIALASALGSVAILVLTLAGELDMSTELWILVAVLFLGGVQLVSVGILGRYLARVHEQTLNRPLYVTSRVVSRAAAYVPATAGHSGAHRGAPAPLPRP